MQYPIDDLLMDDPSGGQPMPFDDPALAADVGEVAPGLPEGEFDHQTLIDNINNPNIAAALDDEELGKIGQKVLREYQIDLDSLTEWAEESRGAMDLAMQVAGKRQGPWPNSSDVIYPLLTTAAIQFAARAYPAIVMGRNVVKGKVTGNDDGQPMIDPNTGQPVVDPRTGQPAFIVQPGAKKARATRVGDHMSWQLLHEMTEWDEETDKLLHILPIVGCAFRKSIYDPSVGTNASMLVLAQNLVINYHAKSMERAPRITECLQYYPYEIEEMVRGGLFLEHAYGTANNSNGDDDAPHDFLEQHRWLDLDKDGYPEPYIVTIHKQTTKVARITARYDAEGVQINRETGKVVQIDPVHYYTKYDLLPNPDGGIYGLGLGKLLSPINAAINTTLNQLFDAGSLQNTGGGFIGRGPSMHSGIIKFKLGEWKMVNVPGQTMREAIVPLIHPGPSAVLFQLLTFLIDAGREVASVKDVLAGDNNPNMQPTTLLAMIEQGLKVFTGIFKRVHRSAGKEFDKLYRLNRIYLKNEARYEIGDEWKTVSKEDYEKGSGVKPISDPSMVTDMQRMARAQFLQSYQNDPDMDRVKIKKRVFEAAQIEDAEELFAKEQPPNPEILAITAELELKGEKIKAEVASAKAQQIKDMSQAVLNLAKADTENAAAPLEWTAQQIELLRLHMERLQAPAEGKAQPSPMQPQEEMPPDDGMGMQPPMDPFGADMDPALAGLGYGTNPQGM